MKDAARRLTIEISPKTIIIALLFGLLVAALFYLRNLVLIVLTAIVIASAIEPGARWFMRFKVPRTAAVLLVYLIVAVFLFGVFYALIPPLISEATGLLSTMPKYLEQLSVRNPFSNVPENSQLLGPADQFSVESMVQELRSSLANLSESFLATMSSVFGGIFSFILIIVFSFYFAVIETSVEDFLRVVTPVQHQNYMVNLWRRSQAKIGLWMQGQLVLALIIGVLTFLGLTILGVRYALLLAIIAGIAELIPVFGPVLSAIPAVAVALIDGGTSLGLMVVALFVIIQQFENHLIYPLVVQKVVGVPPLLVILALLVGGKIAGFLGVILSVPVAAVIQEFVSDLQQSRRDRADDDEQLDEPEGQKEAQTA
jgi:predicted PurR-regulated permease PerM